MTRSTILALWSFGAILLVTCEVVSVLSRRRYAGLSDVLQRMTTGRLRFVVMFVGWMWIGWHFFAR